MSLNVNLIDHTKVNFVIYVFCQYLKKAAFLIIMQNRQTFWSCKVYRSYLFSLTLQDANAIGIWLWHFIHICVSNFVVTHCYKDYKHCDYAILLQAA